MHKSITRSLTESQKKEIPDPNLHKSRLGWLGKKAFQCLYVKESIVFFFVYHSTGRNNKLYRWKYQQTREGNICRLDFMNFI